MFNLDKFLVDLWNNIVFWQVLGGVGVVVLILLAVFILSANKGDSSVGKEGEVCLLILILFFLLPLILSAAPLPKKDRHGGAIRILVTLGALGLWSWFTICILGGISGAVLCGVGVFAILWRAFTAD